MPKAKPAEVPDQFSILYAFVNSIDMRHFIQNGVAHPQSDDLDTKRGLRDWMSSRGLTTSSVRISKPLRREAVDLRHALRNFLACDPKQRRRDKAVRRDLTRAASGFPLTIKVRKAGEIALRPARRDALAGLSAVMAEFHMAAATGALDRFKMCASDECRRIFFDRSKPGIRRWCLSTLCGNRAKTRAYRERQKAAAQS